MSAPEKLAALKASLAIEIATFDYRLAALEAEADELVGQARLRLIAADGGALAITALRGDRRRGLVDEAREAVNDNGG